MKTSKEFFQAIFDAAPAGISICDVAGEYLLANRAFCDCLGYTAQELYGRNYRELTHPADVAASDAQLAQLLSDAKKSYQLEKRFVRRDGSSLWALVSVSLAKTARDTPPCLIAQILDISAQKKFESALLASQASLENAQRIASLGDWESNLVDRTMRWSKEMYRILGLPAPTDTTMTLPAGTAIHPLYLDAIVPDDREAMENVVRNAVRKKEWFAFDHRIIRADGEERTVYARGEPVLDDNGEIVRIVGTLQDTSDRERSEADLLRMRRQLRALSVHQETVVEEERKHIAREVHDEMGQKLTALQLGLSVLGARHASQTGLAASVAELQAMVADSMDVVRHISSTLRPPALDLGLVPAIEWLAEDFRYRWEIDCEVDISGSNMLFGDAIAATLFRVVQESLNNVTRHAQASKVSISLVKADDRVSLTIKDNGRGFDPAVVRKMAGFGLLGMRERVLALAGTLFVKSSPGAGTEVTIKLPLGDTAA